MANICSVYVIVTGDKALIADLYKKIDDQDPEFLKRHDLLTDVSRSSGNDFGLHDYQRNGDNEIALTQCVKWSPHKEWYIDLSDEYPDLNIEVSYEEPADDLYGKFVISGGSCIEDITYTQEQWLEKYDEDYQAEMNRIVKLPYEEFLEEYSDWDCYEEPKFSHLGKTIVARIKDEDLPLFMNVEWMNDKAEEAYKDRYTNTLDGK